MSASVDCEFCNRSFATAQAQMQHARDKHPNGSPSKRVLLCDYCYQPAKLLRSSASIYRGRDYGPVWHCAACEAWVGCHPGGFTPLGRLANAELRAAKQRAHADFDPIWKRRYCSRAQAYMHLADALGIGFAECHIGMFDLEMCRRVVEVCRGLGPALRAAATQQKAAT